MKLINGNFSRQIEIKRQGATQWVIESPTLFASLMQELYQQWEGKEGEFLLLDDDKELNIAKTVEIILNPFTINLQDKRIVNRLYQELQSLAVSEKLYQQTREVMNTVQKYIYELEQVCPYNLDVNSTTEITAIFKALGLQLEIESNDYLETLHLYIKILAELLGKKLIVFLQIGRYFTLEQRLDIQETAAYHDISLLFIETQELDYANALPRYIIDVDGCEI